MQFSHTIKGDILTLKIEGQFVSVEFLDVLERGMTDPGFNAPMRALIDVRQAESPPSAEVPAEQDRCYARIGHCFIPHWAMVAASDHVLFSIARTICTISDLRGVDMRAYEAMDEARCRLTWSNFYQEEPFCQVQIAACRPQFIRPSLKA